MGLSDKLPAPNLENTRKWDLNEPLKDLVGVRVIELHGKDLKDILEDCISFKKKLSDLESAIFKFKDQVSADLTQMDLEWGVKEGLRRMVPGMGIEMGNH